MRPQRHVAPPAIEAGRAARRRVIADADRLDRQPRRQIRVKEGLEQRYADSLEQALRLAHASGPAGSGAEYLLRTARGLDAHGIHDPYIWRLQELVAAEIERTAYDAARGADYVEQQIAVVASAANAAGTLSADVRAAAASLSAHARQLRQSTDRFVDELRADAAA